MQNYVVFVNFSAYNVYPDFRSCNSKILEKVIEYLTKHHEFDKTGTSQEDKDAWDKKYVEVEDEDLFNLILVSNPLLGIFLDIYLRTACSGRQFLGREGPSRLDLQNCSRVH